MKIIKKTLKWFLYFLLIPLSYLLVSLLFASITIDRKAATSSEEKSIYLSTNGVHLDIVIPKENLDPLLLKDLLNTATDHYLSFGWGDENFYVNTPTWGDLTFSNAFRALFLKSSTLLHVTRYSAVRTEWVEVKVSASELQKLNTYIHRTFTRTTNGSNILLKNQGYSSLDNFYKSNGSYSCFNTCNSWVNVGFKESGIKSCLWTPFDFGLLNKHE
ncbi:DUF2459 domain-containing protein [Cellulophaga sp. E6(2014)]|uniref:DUF2459 domain-containing protein n=1 Tax=Cellulophaga sp. E6(2014) TaxID=1495334 RepID=UPI00051CD245|nr:DUF2459 domain-containing protein [Cellulophaga sp. E6(2014)]KGK29422.1 hypothetical protein EL45_15370 [Cellulophaga sp. E6(2014)]